MSRKHFILLGLAMAFFLSGSTQGTYSEISLPALMQKRQQDPNIVILDVRSDGEYFDTASRFRQQNIGRIKGTLHIESQTLQQHPEAVQQLEKYKNQPIYVICSHSYRSRNISRLLIKQGFTEVTNVRGGMTEWFRRYEELSPFRQQAYETSTAYRNISAAELYQDLSRGESPLLIGIDNAPQYFWDSLNIDLYKLHPALKSTRYFNGADSMLIWEYVSKHPGKEVVLFNRVNVGATEIAEWLTGKGRKAAYLVGGLYYFYDYLQDHRLEEKARSFMTTPSSIQFISGTRLCDRIKDGSRMIDLRHDTLFNKRSTGMKEDYTHLQGAENYFAGQGVEKFKRTYPDKKVGYVLVSGNGITGLDLADALAKEGYRISWLNGGLQRFDWYENNVEEFACKGLLIKN